MDFRQVFANRRVVLPVIHAKDLTQSLRNAGIARDADADGVFLINHGMAVDNLLEIHQAVSNEHADWWIGVNCLGVSAVDVFGLLNDRVAGVWTDNAMIDETSTQQLQAERVATARRASGWNGIYFGGVAFKYQRGVDDYAKAATAAAPFMEVVTTSGPGTGRAASLEKIQIMKEALGDNPLAIASGITPKNCGDYVDHADCFLVATGISRSFEEFDADRTHELVCRIRDRS